MPPHSALSMALKHAFFNLIYFPCETCFQEGTSDFGKGVLISEEIRQLLNKVNAALPWGYTG